VQKPPNKTSILNRSFPKGKNQMTDKLRTRKMSTKFLTPAQFGRRHGVSRVTVLTWRKRGFVAMAPDGKRIDVAASEILLADRPAKYRGGEAKALHARGDDPSLADSQRRKEAAQAALAELKLAEASGKLIEVALVKQTEGPMMRGIMHRCLSWPGVFAFEIQSITAQDVSKMRRIIETDLIDLSTGKGFDFSGIPGMEDWARDHGGEDKKNA
jgi:hypothetical protein